MGEHDNLRVRDLEEGRSYEIGEHSNVHFIGGLGLNTDTFPVVFTWSLREEKAIQYHRLDETPADMMVADVMSGDQTKALERIQSNSQMLHAYETMAAALGAENIETELRVE